VLEFLSLMLTTILAWGRPRRDLVLANLLLRHQLAVLARPTRTRPRARPRTRDKLLWVFARRWCVGWREHLTFVTPHTVAVIPLDSGGSIGQAASLVYRLNRPTPLLVVTDGPGGAAFIDPASNALVSLGPDPSTACSTLNCPEGILRTTYLLVNDALLEQGAGTYVPDPNDLRLAQRDCTPVEGLMPTAHHYSDHSSQGWALRVHQ
jgi:hypothetical protein